MSFAKTVGWRVAHFTPSRVGSPGSERWRTAYSYDSKGWPDLFLVRKDRLVAIEVKGTGDSVRKEQLAWLNALREAGVQTAIVTPADWEAGRVERLLR